MSLRWGMPKHTSLSFQSANIMNRHVVTVTCHMILWKSTSINTLWTHFGFTIPFLSTTPSAFLSSDRPDTRPRFGWSGAFIDTRLWW
ncbi:hypothetical protein [uncultured Parabacteroides sp.]|uniref:hypothetical protein n=1 Tax=uncultured Parabacteroides sp. TaxID=512312 RepID=UPI0025F87578|nr:hypothetical protein [uncultured Parabacteroides sp.]